MEENNTNKVIFTTDDGEEIALYVIEETKIGDVNYILVADLDSEDEDSDAYIMKEISDPDEEEATYEFVEDEAELEAIGKIFDELLEDTDVI